MKPKNAKMKKKSLLWMSMLLLMLAGCSSDDGLNEPLLNNNWMLNRLLINNSNNVDAKECTVTNNHFYIDKMPTLDNNCPGFIGVKQDIDAFQVGETFLLNQFNASLIPFEECATTPMQFGATKGSIKLVNKKKVGDKDVLTFLINNLTFERGYTISGTVDFEYEGTVY